MERELSDEEKKFISSFKQQNRRPSSEERRREEKAVRARRGSLLFNWLIASFAVAPFVLSAIFLYSLGRFQSVFGDGSLDYMREHLTDEEVSALGSTSGVDELSTMVELYDSRGTIVAVIFTVFIMLIALAFLARIAARALRRDTSE